MVLVFCTSHNGDINLHKSSSKYLKQFSRYRADTYITEITIPNVQSTIAPKVGLVELWFLVCVPQRIIVYICVKFYQNI